MKKHRLSFLIIISLIFFTNKITSQKKLIMGVNEIDSYYSQNYTPPTKIEFVFLGNPKYVNYFFSFFEEKIKKKFLEKQIYISFRYFNEKIHYNSNEKESNSEFIFFLNIDNTVVIDEKNGYDRVIKFDFNGELKQKSDNLTILSFKTVVKAIHDITNKNKEIIDYLLNKLYIKK